MSKKLPEIKVFGNRLAIVETDEPLSGTIALPQNYQKNDYRLGVVTHVGDGVKCRVSQGDHVLFQIPDAIKKTATYSYPDVDDGPNAFVIISAGDVFGVVDAAVFAKDEAERKKVATSTFRVVGDWVLMGMEVLRANEDVIVLPDNASVRLSDIHFNVLQVGDTVHTADTEPAYRTGTRVFVERARATPIKFDGDEVVLVHKDYIHGAETPATISEH